MQEKVYFCSAIATVVIALYGCAVQPKQVADNCPLKGEEIPAGYTRDDCQCVKNLVQAERSDPEWERRMGRKPKGETTTTASTNGGLAATSAVHTTIAPDYTIHCAQTKLTKEPQPTTQVRKVCSKTGVIGECESDS